MKTAVFIGCWAILIIAVVLISIALGLVGGPAAVCGFLGVVLGIGSAACLYVLFVHSSGEVIEAEIVE